MYSWFQQGVAAAAAFALVFAAVLTLKSAFDYSHAGPQIREISRKYRRYIVVSILRLAFYAFVISLYLGLSGSLIVEAMAAAAGRDIGFGWGVLAAGITMTALASLQFITQLFYIPSSIAASSHYRMSRMHRLWRHLSAGRIKLLRRFTFGVIAFAGIVTALGLVTNRSVGEGMLLAGTLAGLGLLAWAFQMPKEPKPVRAHKAAQPGSMNVLMIGSDTLRADRIANSNYARSLAPRIEALAAQGVYFPNCYVPVARTAPSLVSLLTGAWPQNHGIRDNFVGLDETDLDVETLPKKFRAAGYSTAAISDWAGSDLGKFDFGFEDLDVPPDQWNIKYLIRQGPKDLRLFLSLFTHNRFGKYALPELYYLAGVPLTEHLGRETRRKIRHYLQADNPFFINLFMGTTHPPFGSRYPFYTKYSSQTYNGESKFVMCKLTDPMEIIRSQREPKEAFDLDQILDLYDGCVANFDQEVGKVLDYLDECGCRENTIVVIYSDHGMEFFEHHTWGQGNSAIGDYSARVPLVIHDPRESPVGTVGSLVRSIDLMPTLLRNVLGVTGNGLDGRALPLTPEAHQLPDRIAYFETGIWLTDLPGVHPHHLRYPDLLHILEVENTDNGTLTVKPQYKDIVVQAKDRMIREGKWMLVRLPLIEGPDYKLFNVADDPECQQDLSQAHPDILQRMCRELDAWIDGRRGNGASDRTNRRPAQGGG